MSEPNPKVRAMAGNHQNSSERRLQAFPLADDELAAQILDTIQQGAS